MPCQCEFYFFFVQSRFPPFLFYRRFDNSHFVSIRARLQYARVYFALNCCSLLVSFVSPSFGCINSLSIFLILLIASMKQKQNTIFKKRNNRSQFSMCNVLFHLNTTVITSNDFRVCSWIEPSSRSFARLKVRATSNEHKQNAEQAEFARIFCAIRSFFKGPSFVRFVRTPHNRS